MNVASANHVKQVKSETIIPVKAIRSDNGGKFKSRDSDAFLTSKEISRQLATPHTPQQTGTAERKNQNIMDSARSMCQGLSVELNLSTNKKSQCRDVHIDGQMFRKHSRTAVVRKISDASSKQQQQWSSTTIFPNFRFFAKSDASVTYTHTVSGPYNPRTSSRTSKEVH
ncbi:hypothetical protein BASA62_007535 [Batrachochytrium salamandrivorans]|nr:hypothetical protein BASA62_007535 [Batrachochytrium salamandrivorans]